MLIIVPSSVMRLPYMVHCLWLYKLWFPAFIVATCCRAIAVELLGLTCACINYSAGEAHLLGVWGHASLGKF